MNVFKKVLSIFIILVVAISLAGCKEPAPLADSGEGLFSDGLLAVEINDKWGYINTSGVVVIGFIYDEARAFFEERAVVKEGPHYFIIDAEGNKIFEDGYVFIERDKETGLFWFVKNDLLGLMNGDGGILAEPAFHIGKYTWIDQYVTYSTYFSDGYARVTDGERYGFINTNGDLVLPIDYVSIGHFSKGLVVVSINQKKGYMNASGEVVIPANLEVANRFNENSHAIVAATLETKLTYSVMNISGTVLFTGYDEIVHAGAYYIAKSANGYFLLTTTGQKVYPDGVNYMEVVNGYISLSEVNPNRITILEPSGRKLFELTEPDQNPSGALVDPTGHLYLYYRNGDGTFTIDNGAKRYVLTGESPIQIRGNFVVIRRNFKYGLFTLNGKEIIGFQYDNLKMFQGGIFLYYEGTKFGLLDADGIKITDALYSNYENNK